MRAGQKLTIPEHKHGSEVLDAKTRDCDALGRQSIYQVQDEAEEGAWRNKTRGKASPQKGKLPVVKGEKVPSWAYPTAWHARRDLGFVRRQWRAKQRHLKGS